MESIEIEDALQLLRSSPGFPYPPQAAAVCRAHGYDEAAEWIEQNPDEYLEAIWS